MIGAASQAYSPQQEIAVSIRNMSKEFHPPGQELIEEGVEVKSCFYIRRGSIDCVSQGLKKAALESVVEELQLEIEEALALLALSSCRFFYMCVCGFSCEQCFR